MNYLNETGLGAPQALVENIGQLWERIVDRALEPGGIDGWAVAERVPGTTVVRIQPQDGEPRVLVAIIISGGLRAISEGDPGGVDKETLADLAEIGRTSQLGGMSPRSAAQIVQVSLYGKVKYR
jgi:hypothetical protein